MSNQKLEKDAWPPSIHHFAESENLPVSNLSEIHLLNNVFELSPRDKVLVRFRWWFALAIAANFYWFIEKSFHHIHEWRLLGNFIYLPLAIRGWLLKLKK